MKDNQLDRYFWRFLFPLCSHMFHLVIDIGILANCSYKCSPPTKTPTNHCPPSNHITDLHAHTIQFAIFEDVWPLYPSPILSPNISLISRTEQWSPESLTFPPTPFSNNRTLPQENFVEWVFNHCLTRTKCWAKSTTMCQFKSCHCDWLIFRCLTL